MTETMPPEIEKRMEVIKKHGLVKVIAISVLYLASIFTIGFLISAAAVFVAGLDLNDPAISWLGMGIFAVVMAVDFILVTMEKVSPAILLTVIIMSPIIVLYWLFGNVDIIGDSPRRLPIFFRQIVFC